MHIKSRLHRLCVMCLGATKVARSCLRRRRFDVSAFESPAVALSRSLGAVRSAIGIQKPCPKVEC